MQLRGADVTQNVSRVAQMPRVREWVNAQVRGTAASRRMSWSTAATSARWSSRSATSRSFSSPIRGSGRAAGSSSDSAGIPSEAEIAEETDLIVQRDAKDATQTVQAPDAVLIDTTYLTQEEQVERIVPWPGGEPAPRTPAIGVADG